MEKTEEQQGEKFTLSLSNAAQLTSFALALGITFSIIRSYLYYVLYLHVPIFQYVSLGDIILIAPSGIFWAIYYSSIDAADGLIKSTQFSNIEKTLYGILIYTFAGLLTWIGYHNEPIVEQSMKLVIHNWWYIVCICIYVAVRIYSNNKYGNFFSKNRYVGAFILCIWYAAFDSYASYNVLTNPSRRIHLIIKAKNGSSVNVTKDLIYAGRTNDYWFLYNRKTQYVRAIKNDDIETVDFDTRTLLQ